MDAEERKKRQFIKVILAEVTMVASVVLIVVVATLLAMGFSISQNGKIEQTGLMQLHSMPTGATVEVDGGTLFSRTNLSRTLSAGEHEVTLSRSGYDTWTKRVKIYSGVLTRVYYPRLFLKERTPEVTFQLGAVGLEFLKAAPSRNYIIYALADATEWRLLDMRGDEVKMNVLDMSGVLPGIVDETTTGTTRPNAAMTPRYRFEGEVLELKWSENDDRILAKVRYQEKTEWVLVNLRNLADSLNLTRTFGLDFDQVEMIDGSASQLYALENHQLRRIDTAGKAVSRILVNHVEQFANWGTNVIFVSQFNQSTLSGTELKGREIGVYRDDEKAGTVLARVEEANANVRVALSKRSGEDYMIYTVDNKMVILHGALPSYSEKGADLTELEQLADSRELAQMPEKLSVSSEGQYAVARKGQQWMAMDLDMGELYEYTAPVAELNWLDESMMYATAEGRVTVWDFDGANKRVLVGEAAVDDADLADGEIVLNEKAQSTVEPYAALITTNNRWLYYVTKSDEGWQLMREKIRD